MTNLIINGKWLSKETELSYHKINEALKYGVSTGFTTDEKKKVLKAIDDGLTEVKNIFK